MRLSIVILVMLWVNSLDFACSQDKAELEDQVVTRQPDTSDLSIDAQLEALDFSLLDEIKAQTTPEAEQLVQDEARSLNVTPEKERFVFGTPFQQELNRLLTKANSGEVLSEDEDAALQSMAQLFDEVLTKFRPDKNEGSSADEVNDGVYRGYLIVLEVISRGIGLIIPAATEKVLRIQRRRAMQDLQVEKGLFTTAGISQLIIPGFSLLLLFLAVFYLSRWISTNIRFTPLKKENKSRIEAKNIPLASTAKNTSADRSFFQRTKIWIHTLNHRQSRIFRIGAVVIALLILFPPWIQTKHYSASKMMTSDTSSYSYQVSGHHSFILIPPKNAAGVDLSRLFVLTLIVGVGFYGLIYLNRSKEQDFANESDSP